MSRLQAMQCCLCAEELDVLIAGEISIDVDDWQQHTVYESFSITSTEIVWFWEILRGWTQSQLSKLLMFVTGPCYMQQAH